MLAGAVALVLLVAALSALAALATSDTVLAAILLTALVIKLVVADIAELVAELTALVTGTDELGAVLVVAGCVVPLPALTSSVLILVVLAGWSAAALLEIAALLAPATDVAPLAGATLVDIVALIGAVAVELEAAGTVELVVDMLAGLASVVDGLAVEPSLF
ncbi:hypothetical protein LPA07_09680 [Lactiplantibacillus paraplantarum]|nr:hypothetical protein LPA07_09680 [Lactiplantibacillus paraplantarum]